jgi:hypothetical protein
VIEDNVAAVRELLSKLPEAEPDAVRTAQVRNRCRAELARRADRAARSPSARHGSISALAALVEPVIVGSFCLLYLGVIVMTLRSKGIL